MNYLPDSTNLGSAVEDFHRARDRAALRELLARLTGDSVQLLSYDEVRKSLRLQGGIERGLRDIPLDAIVGSVGRYSDFTRDFLPRRDVEPERWARVKLAGSSLIGLPPIDVYQIGDVYFVIDGNHRVSVARQEGAKTIQAYVTEVQTRVPITPDIRPDDLILKAEYTVFLEQTQLDRLRPEVDLDVSIPGQYPILLEHIQIHQYFMGLDWQRDISYQEAVEHWYDTVYLPVVEMIRARGVLRHFPGRTEADLYLWLAEHRAQLEDELGGSIRPEYAAHLLVEEQSPQRHNLAAQLGKLIRLIIPDKLEGGPPPGSWRSSELPPVEIDRLFKDVLVPVNGKDDGWNALEQAIVLAQREASQLFGLHVRPSDANSENENGGETEEIQIYFERRCQEAGVSGRMAFVTGEVVEQTIHRARLVDLVTINLSYPPAPGMLSRFNSGLRDLLQRSPRPLLVTPQIISPLNKALLAFDGSPKSQEALFIATYLAGAWKIPLVVCSVIDEGRVGPETLQHAQAYLETHQVHADYILESGSIQDALLHVSRDHACDFLILGGYGVRPLLEVILGSQMDNVLRQSSLPMLICQ